MLKTRLLTAVVLLPLLLWFLVQGPAEGIFIFLLFCVCISVYEMSTIFVPALANRITLEEKKISPVWSVFAVVVAIQLFVVSTLDFAGAERGGIVTGIVLILVVGTFLAKDIDRSIVNMTGIILSVSYGGLPWLSVWDLYLLKAKAGYLLLTLAIVMMGDSGAYFAGRKWGQHQLAPNLSPKKTWEGFAGGLLGSVIGALGINGVYQFELGPFWLMIVAALFGGIAGVLGDLVESAFKRFSQVKDSGVFFPGHGGFLDRADSLLIAAPVVWFVIYCYKSMGFE